VKTRPSTFLSLGLVLVGAAMLFAQARELLTIAVGVYRYDCMCILPSAPLERLGIGLATFYAAYAARQFLRGHRFWPALILGVAVFSGSLLLIQMHGIWVLWLPLILVPGHLIALLGIACYDTRALYLTYAPLPSNTGIG